MEAAALLRLVLAIFGAGVTGYWLYSMSYTSRVLKPLHIFGAVVTAMWSVWFFYTGLAIYSGWHMYEPVMDGSVEAALFFPTMALFGTVAFVSKATTQYLRSLGFTKKEPNV